MKKSIPKIWQKNFLSSILSCSLLLSSIIPAIHVAAASPATIPNTLILKETTGICSGTSTAFNVNSDAFDSSKLKFYQDMLNGSHEKSNASTKANAPAATSFED